VARHCAWLLGGGRWPGRCRQGGGGGADWAHGGHQPAFAGGPRAPTLLAAFSAADSPICALASAISTATDLFALGHRASGSPVFGRCWRWRGGCAADEPGTAPCARCRVEEAIARPGPALNQQAAPLPCCTAAPSPPASGSWATSCSASTFHQVVLSHRLPCAPACCPAPRPPSSRPAVAPVRGGLSGARLATRAGAAFAGPCAVIAVERGIGSPRNCSSAKGHDPLRPRRWAWWRRQAGGRVHADRPVSTWAHLHRCVPCRGAGAGKWK